MFTLNGGNVKVWIFAGENRHDAALQVKKGKGRVCVMFWGAISPYELVAFKRVNGYQNSNSYEKMLEDCLPAYRQKFIEEHGRDICFQQDNASCHVSGQLMDFFDREQMYTLRHPPKSPDLNPIENIWGLMKQDIARRAPMNEAELCQFVKEAWLERTTGPKSAELLMSLFNSMSARIEAVILNGGNRTKY
ncbi:putative Transposable element Tc3 transposase [Hypsibius exemplaris]|nr:putative Transposable element Tc3 transposase [Hypsibius exemplaris]